MPCENELAELQAAILTRTSTALALLQANSVKMAADMNYTAALAADNVAAALVAAKQAAYDQCLLGQGQRKPSAPTPPKKKGGTKPPKKKPTTPGES